MRVHGCHHPASLPGPTQPPSSLLTWRRLGRASSSSRGCELGGEDGGVRRVPGPLSIISPAPHAAGSSLTCRCREGGCGMPGWGRRLWGCPGSPPASAARPGEGREMPVAEISPRWGRTGVCGGCPGLTWKRVAILSGEVSPLAWLGGGAGDLGTKGELGGDGSCICSLHPWHGVAVPLQPPPGRCSSPRPPTGTSRPGNGCQGCLASLPPDSFNYRAGTGSCGDGTAPRVTGGEKQLVQR